MVVINEDVFGVTSNGNPVRRFTFINSNGLEMELLSLGATIRALRMPDRNGKVEDIVLGYDSVAEYEVNGPSFGSLCGRVANRIADGRFTIDGQVYSLAVNEGGGAGPNHLHGGWVGFNKKLYECTIRDQVVEMTYTSPDGEEGYPGDLMLLVTYELTEDGEVIIDYSATCSKPTPVNLTNHAYFNLAGHTSANICDHTVAINAEKFTPKNDKGVPTGELASVGGTLFDLRKPILLGDVIQSVPGGIGYDMNFCVEGTGKKYMARAEHEASGRVMEVYSDQPGVQLYTSYYLDGERGKQGAVHNRFAALCLETQNYPDAINQPNFPRQVLRPGDTYRHTAWYKFSTKK